MGLSRRHRGGDARAIRLLASEDELAAVLAHEIAHVNRKHQWKVIQKQKLIAMAGEAVTRAIRTARRRLSRIWAPS